MTNETEIDTIVIDKVMKFWDLLFCDCCYIGICLLYSPRVWRWSWQFFVLYRCVVVFSTCVEVIPSLPFLCFNADGILHVCGGDPSYCLSYFHYYRYSPRVWRWSPSQNIVKQLHPVFSTYVEVLLYWDSWRNHECNYTRPQGKILKSQASKKQKEIFNSWQEKWKKICKDN